MNTPLEEPKTYWVIRYIGPEGALDWLQSHCTSYYFDFELEAPRIYGKHESLLIWFEEVKEATMFLLTWGGKERD